MKRLNAYHFTDTFIKEGVAYLTRGTIPERFEFESRKNEFRARYQDMSVGAKGTLFVGERQVVPEAQIESVLAAHYKLLGDLGRDRFYAYVAEKYVGISRPRVQQFLNNQEIHQLVQQVKTQRVNMAIVAARPMERWQADLVDVSKYKSPQNGNATFLLTVVNCFSKFAWVVALRNKEAATVAAAIETIFAANGSPTVVQTDNGGEFDEEFEKALVRWGVLHARSRPYNPQANGQIERFNGTLKRMIQVHMLIEETKTYLPQLQALVTRYNNLLHTGIGKVPARVHTNGTQWHEAYVRLKAQAMRNKGRGCQKKRPVLAVGDHVRTAIIAKPLEKLSTFWSRELFEVMAVQQPVHEWEAALYILHDGRKFTRDRLQKVDKARLVPMNKTKQPKKKTAAQKRVQPEVVPRKQPQRERAPSSLMRDTYVDL